MKNRTWFNFVVLGISIALVFSVVLYFWHMVGGESSGLGFDWKIIYASIQGGRFNWGEGLYNPPWGVLFLLPLGLLPLGVSWSIMVTLTLGILVLTLPRRREEPSSAKRIASAILLMSSYMVLRAIADTNVDAVVLGGVLLLLYGYRQKNPYWLALGALLSAMKPQSVFLLLIILVVYIIRRKDVKNHILPGLLVLALVIISMLTGGQAWLSNINELSGRLSVSLNGSLVILGIPVWVRTVLATLVALISFYAALRSDNRLTRIKAAMLIAGALLVAPYANGLSIILVLALGVLPLFLRDWRIGGMLFLLHSGMYLRVFGMSITAEQDFVYTSMVLLVTWIVLLAYIMKERLKTEQGQLSKTFA